jgi:hypothetical protein
MDLPHEYFATNVFAALAVIQVGTVADAGSTAQAPRLSGPPGGGGGITLGGYPPSPEGGGHVGRPAPPFMSDMSPLM